MHVRRLREKLPFLAEALVTVKQFGYKLLDPAPAARATPAAAPEVHAVRLDFRRTLLLTSLGATAAALVFVWLVMPAAPALTARGARPGRGLGASWRSWPRRRSRRGYRARAAAIADVGRRYALGDLSRPGPDYGDDDLGMAARALDAAVHEQGRRVDTLSRDRARMEAILGSMVEGVLVVDETGRLQLVNDAARRMLRVEGDAVGRPYVEAIRHPGHRRALRQGAAPARRPRPSSCRSAATARATWSPGWRRSSPPGAARSWCCTTSPTSSAPTRSAATSSPTCRTSCARRSPPSAAMPRRCSTTPDDAEARQRFLEIIQRHAARMERLVKDLLRLARLDAGQERSSARRADVPALCRGRGRRPGAVDRGEAAGGVGRRRWRRHGAAVRVDAAKLHDILRNLVENAVNYTQPGGAVDVWRR